MPLGTPTIPSSIQQLLLEGTFHGEICLGLQLVKLTPESYSWQQVLVGCNSHQL